MHVKNLTCYNSAGIAIGSLGQYEGVRDVVENITAEDVSVKSTPHHDKHINAINSKLTCLKAFRKP